MKAESKQIPQKLATRLKFVCCSYENVTPTFHKYVEAVICPIAVCSSVFIVASQFLLSVC